MTAKEPISRIDATFSRETSDSLCTKVPNPRLRCAARRRAIDRDELLKIANTLEIGWEQYGDDTIAREDAERFERGMAALIRKAVGA